MNRSTLRNRIGTRKVRRLTTIALAGSVLALAVAAPAGAQTIGADGKIYAYANCNLATKTASVSVVVMEPFKFAKSGLVFYTQVYAKGRWETQYNLIRQAQSRTIKTWSTYVANPFVSNQPDWMNSATTVMNTAFTGRIEGTYDIYVRYWFRVPTATSWAGPYGFTVATDPHSEIDVTSNDGFGNLTSPAFTCHL